MNDGDRQWERLVIERLANGALAEQRRARRWGIFFKLLTFAYITWIIVVAVDWKSAENAVGSARHTAVIEIDGIIAPGANASAERIGGALRAAFKDKGTQGVLLRINSPGGSPVQSQALFDEIRRLRKVYPKVPLYAVVEDVCASGGYYIAAAADKIYVSKSSIIGSIGVRMDGFGLTGLMEKLGVERRLLTAGENKGMLDPFLPLDDKHKQHAIALMKEIHEQFIAAVREGRGTRLKEDGDTFSGLIWSGQKSIDIGIADALGGVESVARDVIKAETLVDFTQKEGVAERLAKRFGAAAAAALSEFSLRAPAQLR